MMDLHHLPNQRPGEKVLLFLRRHWMTPTEIIFYMILLYIVPFGVVSIFLEPLTTYIGHPVFGPLITIVGSMYAMGVWLFGFMEITDYYLDTWIVTNERILNIEQKGLFTRVASELHLSAIQDATSEIHGMLRTLLNFGNVHIQTAGEKTRFIFKDIPHPEKIREQILHCVDEDKQRHQHELVAAAAGTEGEGKR